MCLFLRRQLILTRLIKTVCTLSGNSGYDINRDIRIPQILCHDRASLRIMEHLLQNLHDCFLNVAALRIKNALQMLQICLKAIVILLLVISNPCLRSECISRCL